MKTHKSPLLRLLTGLLTASLFITTGCKDELPGGKPVPAAPKKTTAATNTNTTANVSTNPTASVPPTPASNVTGNWYYKAEIMRLKQTGASIQGSTEVVGFVSDPADPIESPVPTVGSMLSDGTVKITEIINYIKNPKKNYEVAKVGRLQDNTLTLDVISGQDPHTQTWKRK